MRCGTRAVAATWQANHHDIQGPTPEQLEEVMEDANFQSILAEFSYTREDGQQAGRRELTEDGNGFRIDVLGLALSY